MPSYYQVQGHINCCLEFAPGSRPEGYEIVRSEPLVWVIAAEDIEENTELLLDYGPHFFDD